MDPIDVITNRNIRSVRACKMDKSLNRGMFNKFHSRKICVAGYQCDTSDFDFCIAEHNELPVIKICFDEGRDDCQQWKKGLRLLLELNCDNCKNSFFHFNFV